MSDKPARILVVDDRAEARKLLVLRLQHDGHSLQQASSGAQALAMATADPPDLVLLDVLMPEMDGFEVCRRLRRLPALQAVPVVMLTALEATDDLVRGLEAGADDFITKPVNMAELRARVRSLLRVKTLFDQVQQQQVALAQWSATLEQRVAAGVAQIERISRLKRFFSPRLAERLVGEAGEQALRLHRGEITVLFADLRGFTGFAEHRPVEEVMALLSSFHSAMGELIFAAEGTLERFTGDGMMVFFNDPDPQPDHSVRALNLAVALQHRACQLAAHWPRDGAPAGLAVGLARGMAALGALGSESRVDYAAIGAATNLAARLCAEAAAGEIWLSDAVFAHLPAESPQLALLRPLPPLLLKGLASPVQAWRLPPVANLG